MTPFHQTSTHLLPSTLYEFLDHSTLSQLSQTNRNVYHQVQRMVAERKHTLFQDVIYYFYYSGYQSTERRGISLLRRYDEQYAQNVCLLFHFLPELFHFIQQHNVTFLNMESNCISEYELSSYGISSDRLKHVANEMLQFLSHNTTLEWCNFGIFYHVMEQRDIEQAIQHHPTIDYISLFPTRSTRSMRTPASTIWRDPVYGTFYWSHWRKEE